MTEKIGKHAGSTYLPIYLGQSANVRSMFVNANTKVALRTSSLNETNPIQYDRQTIRIFSFHHPQQSSAFQSDFMLISLTLNRISVKHSQTVT